MTDQPQYGAATLDLLHSLLDSGVERVSLLTRHSAREYARDKHDLLNPLTEAGRQYSTRFGLALDKTLHVRGYASPPERCVETATLAIDAHQSEGGDATPVRPVESLGVFYALDQIKMWKGMQIAGGLAPYVRAWVDGELPADAMIPSALAAPMLASAAVHRLRTAKAPRHVDLCVSHDITLMMVKHELLGEVPEEHSVAYLDGVAVFEADGEIWAQSVHGTAHNVTEKVHSYTGERF